MIKGVITFVMNLVLATIFALIGTVICWTFLAAFVLVAVVMIPVTMVGKMCETFLS